MAANKTVYVPAHLMSAVYRAHHSAVKAAVLVQHATRGTLTRLRMEERLYKAELRFSRAMVKLVQHS